MIKLTEEMARVSEAAMGRNHPDTAVAYRRLAEAQFQMVRHLTGVGMTLTPEIIMWPLQAAAWFRWVSDQNPSSSTTTPAGRHSRNTWIRCWRRDRLRHSSTPRPWRTWATGFWCSRSSRQSRELYEHGLSDPGAKRGIRRTGRQLHEPSEADALYYKPSARFVRRHANGTPGNEPSTFP